MSCLKTASTIFSGLDAEPKKKVQLTIAAEDNLRNISTVVSPANLPTAHGIGMTNIKTVMMT